MKRSPKKGLPWIWAYFCPKNGSGYKSQGGGQNISRGGSCHPTSRAYVNSKRDKIVNSAKLCVKVELDNLFLQ